MGTNSKEYMLKTKLERLGEERLNKQGCLMKIVQYNMANDIVVEFQDDYKYKIHTTYANFKKETVINPYYPSICGVGIKGAKYPASYIDANGNTIHTKGYDTFKSMITRCYNSRYHIQQPTYSDVWCCEEWLNRDNFEDWLRSQSNYNKFLNGGFALDKDILIKGNKIYSPDACCLVPQKINELFQNDKQKKDGLPKGVKKHGDKYTAYCCVNSKNTYIGTYDIEQDAFNAYKTFKESLIKQMAKEEFDKENITKACYNAMINYKVETTD